MSILKTRVVDLVTNAVVSPAAWDADKPYLAGNMREKTVNGAQAVGAALTKAVDVGNDFTLIPSGIAYYDEVNGRLYILTTFVTNQARVLLYNVTRTSLVAVPVGQISIPFPATPTFKELIVEGTGTTDLKIKVLTTNTTAGFGGLFITQKVDIADFQMVGFTTFSFAFNQTDAKATYKHVTSTQPGSLNVAGSGANNVSVGQGMLEDSNVLRVFNGTAAALRAIHFDQTVAPVHSAPTVTITIATPGVVTFGSAHNLAVNDPKVFSTTGALPTGLVAGTVYFVSATNFTSTTFSVSATVGGAAINTTGTQSGTHRCGRAYGEGTANAYLGSSGDVTPVLAGTILTTQNASLKIMPSGVNAGQKYVAIGTTTNTYRIKLADFAIGSASFPSTETVNILSTTPSPLITAPVAVNAIWVDDPYIDRWLYTTNTVKIVEKPFLNNTIYRVFGSLFNRGTENQNLETLNFGGLTITGIMQKDGILFLSTNTTNQRAVIMMDYKSDAAFDYSYILSPVITVNKAVLCFINTIEALFESTGTVRFYYKTSGFSGAFSGYTEINTAEELSILLGTQVQLAIKTDCAVEDASTHAQLKGLLLSLLEPDAMDSHWALYQKYSSNENDSPFYATFRLQKAYEASEGGMPSELLAELIDDSDNVVATYSTVADIANFSVSSNDGSTFSALVGVPSNTQYTLLRCLIDSPAAGKLRARIRGV